MKKSYRSLLLFLLLPVLSLAQTVTSGNRVHTGKSAAGYIDYLNSQSWVYHLKNARKALEYGSRAISESKKYGYWKGLAYANKNMGAAYSILGEYDSAAIYLNRAQLLFDESGNLTESGNVSNLIGLLYWETGKYDSALVAYDNAFRKFNHTADEEGKSIIYTNRGIIYYETGNYAKALSNYNRGLRISEKLHDSSTLSSVHTNIGIIYSITGNYKRAITHHRAALSYDNIGINPSGCAKYFTNIGTCYFHLEQFDSSLFYHRKALHLYTKTGEKKGIARTLLNIGSLYQQQKNYRRAENYFLRGLSMNTAIGDETGKIIGASYTGKLYLLTARYSEAEKYLLQAYNGATRLHSVFYKTEISLMLAQLYDQLQQPDKANQFFRIYARANDRLLKEKGNHQLVELQIGLATHEKQQLITHLQQQQKSNHQQRSLLIGSLVFLLLLSVFVFRRLRKRHLRKQQQLEEELTANRLALEAFTRELANRTPNDDVIVSEDDAEKLIALQQLGQARLVTDADWEKFKLLFEKVHPLFMVNLKQSFPEISPAEIRLAALLLLHLSSKEIAAIVGISPESVKKARQRLRKKLQIDTETALETFLFQFSTR